MAERFAAEGMKVVLADVEHEALAAAERECRARGSAVLPVRTDVSRAAERCSSRLAPSYNPSRRCATKRRAILKDQGQLPYIL